MSSKVTSKVGRTNSSTRIDLETAVSESVTTRMVKSPLRSPFGRTNHPDIDPKSLVIRSTDSTSRPSALTRTTLYFSPAGETAAELIPSVKYMSALKSTVSPGLYAPRSVKISPRLCILVPADDDETFSGLQRPIDSSSLFLKKPSLPTKLHSIV